MPEAGHVNPTVGAVRSVGLGGDLTAQGAELGQVVQRSRLRVSLQRSVDRDRSTVAPVGVGRDVQSTRLSLGVKQSPFHVSTVRCLYVPTVRGAHVPAI